MWTFIIRATELNDDGSVWYYGMFVATGLKQLRELVLEEFGELDDMEVAEFTVTGGLSHHSYLNSSGEFVLSANLCRGNASDPTELSQLEWRKLK